MTIVETGHQAFISFSSIDQAKAKLICERLEQSGIRCWISLRDVEPGGNYQASIVSAIQTARIMVLVFSDNTNQSQEIQKELSLASAFKVAVMPVRISDARPVGAMLYELATRQWIDAFEDWDRAMLRLTGKARAILAADGPVSVMEAATSSIARQSVELMPPRKIETTPATVFSRDQLDAARLALAHFLGPIADVLVRRASAKATSLADLYDRLAAHIRSVDEQTAFRRRVGDDVRQGKAS